MLFKTNIFLSVFIFVFYLAAPAQKRKADLLYKKGYYYKAIAPYQKSIKRNDSATRQESLIRLADCYRILNEYTSSELYYKQAIDDGATDPEVYYNYASVLKSNRQYPLALEYFKAYLKAKPTDKKAEYALTSCREIQYWQSKPQEYTINLMDGINTSRSEFGPVLINHELFFTAERQSDYVEYPVSGFDGEPFFNIYYKELNHKNAKTKSVSKKINTDYHDGPVALSADGKTMYLTRVDYTIHRRQKDFVNHATLYTSIRTGKKWHTPLPFAYNSTEYSCAHASLSEDGNTLFFSSDMPGGVGGQDIWMCQKNGDGWEKPVNLGFDINTSGDELFPYSRQDGTLFFSSNGLPGFGGLDIFSANQKNGVWLLKRNEGLFLNSSSDDFTVFFVNDSTGYFSSNREGGKGKDDIYTFKYTNKYTLVEGIILLTENTQDPAVDVKVYLLDETGKLMDSTRTNGAGYFAFRNLEMNKVYMAEVDEGQTPFKDKARYYLADKNQVIVRVSHEVADGKKFVFKSLPIDVNGLPDLYKEGELSLAGNLLYGDNPVKPLAHKRIKLINFFGDVTEEAITNEFGAFVFRHLPLNQDYTLSVEDADIPLNTKIILTNKKGKEVKTMRSEAGGKFKFTLLSIDKTSLDELDVLDKDLIMTVKGYIYDQHKKPLSEVKLTFYEKNTIVERGITDQNGRFDVKNLSTDKAYVFSVDETDPRMAAVTKIYIGDSNGKIYKELVRNKANKFQFNMLAIDKTSLGEFMVDDPWLLVLKMKDKETQGALTIMENLTYAYDDYHIDASGKNILDKVIGVLTLNPNLAIELSSHTDSRSSDAYNMALSQKRAKAAVDYMVSKGIPKSRLKAIGYGESKLLNHCKNSVSCTEEEHAVNRRTEFKIVEVGKM